MEVPQSPTLGGADEACPLGVGLQVSFEDDALWEDLDASDAEAKASLPSSPTFSSSSPLSSPSRSSSSFVILEPSIPIPIPSRYHHPITHEPRPPSLDISYLPLSSSFVVPLEPLYLDLAYPSSSLRRRSAPPLTPSGKMIDAHTTGRDDSKARGGGLKRALSWGSASRRSSSSRRLSAVVRQGLDSLWEGGGTIHQHHPHPRPHPHHHHAAKGPMSESRSSYPCSVPGSGPSSPCTSPLSRPGRVISGLSDGDNEGLMSSFGHDDDQQHHDDDDRDTTPSTGSSLLSSSTHHPSHPPAAPPLAARTDLAYCPSPALTPSPDPSLPDSVSSPILSTPAKDWPCPNSPHAHPPSPSPSPSSSPASASSPSLDNKPAQDATHLNNNTALLFSHQAAQTSPPPPPPPPAASSSFPATLSPLLPSARDVVKARREASSMSYRSPHLRQDREQQDHLPKHTFLPDVEPISHRHHPQHLKQPSVPFSTRTVSTLSGELESTTSAPFSSHSFRRHSKLTTPSGSSDSSLYSSDSARGGHHHLADRPDISTVFEEEVDVNLEEPPQRTAASAPSATSDYRYPITHHASASTLISHRPRNGTVSSAPSTRSGKSNKSVHPFASVVIQPPPPPGTRPFLTPQHSRAPTPSSTLANSRSHPNLAESYSMSNMASAPPIAIVSSQTDKEDEDVCPICVESLSFSYRLPGEKPHVVPECGHALHEECFVTVYGEVPPEGSRKQLGVCGVCRQPMRIQEGGGKKFRAPNKLAMLTGTSSKPVLTHTVSAPSVRSGRATSPDPETGDDPIEGTSGMSSGTSSRSVAAETSNPHVVVPSISIRSEFPSISKVRSKKGKPTSTAMITVQVPAAGDRGRYPPIPRRLEPPPLSPAFPPSPRSASDMSLMSSNRLQTPQTPESFAHIITDLRHRVPDFRTSGLDQLGALRLFDILSVRKGPLVREFHVYLFQEALICINEDKPSAIRKIFSSSSSSSSRGGGNSSDSTVTGKSTLKLKGRIYLRHVRKITDSSNTTHDRELSVTIAMEEEGMDSFVLVFKDKGSHETWRATLSRMIDEMRYNAPAAHSASKVAKLMGTGAPTPRTLPGSIRSPSSNTGTSFGDMTSPASAAFSGASSVPMTAESSFIQPLAPKHTPLDLVIIMSLPAPTAAATPLKIRLMRQAISFVLALLGPKDRISLIATELGPTGTVRKTPLLSMTRSAKRLDAFVELLGTGRGDGDEFAVPSSTPDERQDVVAGVNVALDVLLQRKTRNPITGMILISDTSDIIKRAQMDLVTARLDAANTPIHAIGYGKSHDPSPLWMLSNHTQGTYTFVKEWYDLRDSLAGVVGGLMSVAVTNMKLHLDCRENNFRVVKISGAHSAIVSSNGKDVDIELRELRFGEIREILVELDMDGVMVSQRNSAGEDSGGGEPARQQNGFGLESLSVNDSTALMRDAVYEDGLIDDLPVTEVDCSYTDPAAGRSVARLAHPVLLTVALLPSSAPPSSTPPDPTIVRRRMELLVSDMITRALLIASRKNYSHATRILRETRRIVETISEQVRQTMVSSGGGAGSKREMQSRAAMEGMEGMCGDIEVLLDGLEEHRELFERDHRNFSAQQAVVLRAQKSWTTRSATERQYCTKEVREIIQLSAEWQDRRARDI